MKFKAVIITKNKLIIGILSAAVVTAAGVGLAAADIRGIDNEAAYVNIIESASGTGDRAKNIIDNIKSVLGFDLSAPETIIEGFTGIGRNKEGKKGEDMDIYEETAIGEPPMADGETIAKAEDIKLNNATDYEVDINGICSEDLGFSLDFDGVEVLIMHTHTTECYNGDQMQGETERTTDTEKSVVAVGDEIQRALEENGIGVYHDTTFHDYPSYQGSYTRALSTIEKDIRDYPNIKVILDIHRDAFVYEDGTKLTVTRENSDIPMSQVMLVSGTDSMGLYDPNWRENLKFAAKIQNAAEIMYPGLMRTINLRTERFNLHVTTGSLIIEVGSNGNTLEEAKNSGRAIGRAIAAVLAK